MKVKQRFFLTIGEGPEREVTEREYRQVEATYFDTPRSSFSCVPASGRIKTEIEE